MTQQHYRWSGLAAIAGAALFIGVFVWVGVVVGMDTSIEAFPSLRAGRTIENALYLAVLVLWIAPLLALGDAIRDVRPGLARYGSVVGVAGLIVLAVGALPHVVGVPLADLYHASSATAADRATLDLVWQANQAMMTVPLVTGLAILPVGEIALGLGLRSVPALRPSGGIVSIALGIVGLAVAVVLLVDPQSPIAAVGFFALIAFNLVAGWRLISLARVADAPAAWAPAATGRSAG